MKEPAEIVKQELYTLFTDQIDLDVDNYVRLCEAAGGTVESKSCVLASFTDLGYVPEIFYYYDYPPAQPEDSYVFSTVNTLSEVGTKDEFMAEVLITMTVVDAQPDKFPNLDKIRECGKYIMELLATRGQRSWATRIRFSGSDTGADKGKADKSSNKIMHYKNYNFNALIPSGKIT